MLNKLDQARLCHPNYWAMVTLTHQQFCKQGNFIPIYFIHKNGEFSMVAFIFHIKEKFQFWSILNLEYWKPAFSYANDHNPSHPSGFVGNHARLLFTNASRFSVGGTSSNSQSISTLSVKTWNTTADKGKSFMCFVKFLNANKDRQHRNSFIDKDVLSQGNTLMISYHAQEDCPAQLLGDHSTWENAKFFLKTRFSFSSEGTIPSQRHTTRLSTSSSRTVTIRSGSPRTSPCQWRRW